MAGHPADACEACLTPTVGESNVLTSLCNLLMVGQLMTQGSSEGQILQLAVSAVPSLAPARTVAIELLGAPSALPGLAVQLDLAGSEGGAVLVPDAAWAWAYGLTSRSEALGYLVVAADVEPSESGQFLLRSLAQQTGAALANRRQHAADVVNAADMVEANARLRSTVDALRRSMDIHSRLTEVAVCGEGPDGIARTVHELTGLSVAIEDRHGNLCAWMGPGCPDPYPKEAPATRERLLSRALRSAGPLRVPGRAIALAHPQGDVLGVIALIDPDGVADDAALTALEHAATILAMELARLRTAAESELRLCRDLVESVLTGGDEQASTVNAAALGYDLARPHRVVVLEGAGRNRDADAFFQAVRSAAAQERAGSLLATRGSQIVLLATAQVDGERLRAAVLRELGGGRVRLGIGEVCAQVEDFPRSYRQAGLALSLPAGAEWGDRAVRFDDLGVYRLFSGMEDLGEVERFAQTWLGALIEYDNARGSDLVRTLTMYLSHGGSYETTAEALIVHRNTLKYRLQRIRQITGLDLGDAETCFNLQLATRAWATLRVLRTAS